MTCNIYIFSYKYMILCINNACWAIRGGCTAAGCFNLKNNINRRGWPASCASGRKEAVRTRRIQEPTQRAIPRLTPPSAAEGHTYEEDPVGAAEDDPEADAALER